MFDPVYDLLRAQLREKADEYTSYKDTTLWVGTYNLNGKSPSSESLLPWLFPADGGCLERSKVLPASLTVPPPRQVPSPLCSFSDFKRLCH